MKKIIAFVLSILTVMVMFCGCGKKKDDYSDEISALQEAQAEIAQQIAEDSGLTTVSNDSDVELHQLTSEEVKWDIDKYGNLTVKGKGYLGGSGWSWLAEASRIVSITLEEGIEGIDGYCFDGVATQNSIHFPSTIKTIDGCPNAKEIYLAGYDTLTNAVFNVCIFKGSEKLYIDGKLIEDLIIPDGISSIASNIYSNCPVKSITIPDGVKSIEANAFADVKLEKIIIPDSVEEIGAFAFEDSEIDNVYLGKGVKVFDTQGRSVYDMAPNCKNLFITDLEAFCNIEHTKGGEYLGVAYCNAYFNAENFYVNNKLVTELYVPESIEILPEFSLNGLLSVETIHLSNNIGSIYMNAFNEDPFPKICFDGTEEEWNKVAKLGQPEYSSTYFYMKDGSKVEFIYE